MSEGRNMIMGWGYEGRTADDLVNDCQVWGVTLVVDVRLNPVSRRAGFSKRQLASRLEEAGIAYRHSKALGNPRDNRDGFADTTGEAGAMARGRFAVEVLESEEAQVALDEILRASEEGIVLLLCYEASERHCHRQCVKDALAQRAAQLLQAS